MIQFHTEDISMPDIDTEQLPQWITQVAANYGKNIGQINYIFVNDQRILEVNQTFLRHDYYTDIITFDYSEGNIISGDLYISLETVESNAALLKCNYEQELHRVIIHGILHLCGINDKGPGERAEMEQHEDQALLLRIPKDN